MSIFNEAAHSSRSDPGSPQSLRLRRAPLARPVETTLTWTRALTSTRTATMVPLETCGLFLCRWPQESSASSAANADSCFVQ
ncbi:hypothetical protein WMY93_025914 [Mugilogobius chulae]|uniref:Uncharacterized protein n=1 Tax=Mugilogobius chulae TaxID=88201 RepID=A0AAW0N6X7_9GOBI